MNQAQQRDNQTVVTALRTALVDGTTTNPGQVRLRVETELGPDHVMRLRPLVHQVVAASEEGVATQLGRISRLSPESFAQMSGELAQARGWAPQIAQRVVLIWADALGVDSESAQDAHPPTPVPIHPPPPQLATHLPPHHRPPASPPPVTPPADSQQPQQPSVMAYAGAHWALVAVLLLALMGGLLTLVILAPAGAPGVALPLVSMLLTMPLVAWLSHGRLSATSAGLTFVPLKGAAKKERPELATSVPWQQIRVEPGFVSKVHLGQMRVQVGPRNRAFVNELQGQLTRMRGAVR